MVVNQGSVIPPFLSELPAKIHSMEVSSCVSPLHFAEEKLNRKKPQHWPERICRILSNCTARQVWRLCGLAECCLAPLAGPLTSDVCVFWATAQSWVQPVSRLGQTKQTKPVQPPKEKHDQDQQTELNMQEEGIISKTRTAFAALSQEGLEQPWR